MADLTWRDDVQPFVQAYYEKPGVRPNPKLYLALGNACLHKIADAVGGFATSWTTAEGGTLTLVGATVDLPGDLLDIHRVDWAGDELPFRARGWLDRNQPDWRTDTGTPAWYSRTARQIILDSAPGADGPLVIWGLGTLPEFSEDPADPNPLSYLPRPHQLAPAHYILSELPVAVSDKGETQLGFDVGTIQHFAAKWAAEWPLLIQALTVRMHPATKG